MTGPVRDLELPMDLTRWNRAGLRQFRYLRGNAAEYLELLRVEFGKRSPHWESLRLSGTDTDAGAALARILAQYAAPRRDYAWEIARTFARAAHVLGEHTNAFANEGFVETATQWDLLRKLVDMIDYHPAPPSSAFTVLVLLAKPHVNGRVAPGLGVKHTPASGAPPVVFETLTELMVDARLNAVRLARWDVSEEPFDPVAQANAPWRAEAEMELSVGSLGVLRQEAPARKIPGAPDVVPAAQVVEVAAIDRDSGVLRVEGPAGLGGRIWRRGTTVLHTGAAKVLRPRLNGPGVFQLERGSGLAVGDIVGWHDGTWRFSAVNAADGDRVRLVGNIVPNGELHRAAAVSETVLPPAAPEFLVPFSLRAAAYRASSTSLTVLHRSDFAAAPAEVPAHLRSAEIIAALAGAPTHLRLPRKIPATELFVVLAGAPTHGRAMPLTDPEGAFRFDGAAKGMVTGTWLVAEHRDAAGLPIRRAVQVRRVEQHERDWFLWLDPQGESLSNVPASVGEDLRDRLRHVRPLLDESAMRTILLRELVSGTVRGRSVREIQAVGPTVGAALRAAGITTIGDLAALAPQRSIDGVKGVTLSEIVARADQLLAFAAVPTGALAPFLHLTLLDASGRIGAGLVPVGTLSTEETELVRVHGPFRHQLRPRGHDRNPAPLPARDSLRLAIDPTDLPVALKAGRLLVLEREDGSEQVHQSVIERIQPAVASRTTVVRLAEPVPTVVGLTLGNTIVRANAVPASHGEAKGVRVLGSGDAARRNQEFTLAIPGVSFVPDASMPSGVRADVQVLVDAERWTQVATLRDSRPTDAHFVVRVTEEGWLRFGFGGGEYGRRLPTGTNNVRATHRLGSGLVGNQPAHRLTTLATPHPLIAAVRQPLPAIGGNDLETVSSLRVNAPASVRTMERAVSLQDYADLASSQSSVWQAVAFAPPSWAGRDEPVMVVLVPASGASLDAALQPVVPIEFLRTQQHFLTQHAPPGIAVSVRCYEPILLDFRVSVRVRSAAFDPPAVVERVREAVRNAYRLERRRLGAAAHRSDLYAIVDAVVGVENSTCELSVTSLGDLATRPRRVVTQNDAGRVVARSIDPQPHQVAYLDPDRSTLVVTASEFAL